MKVRTKRYFLIGMLAAAGLGTLLCVGILVLGMSRPYGAENAALMVAFVVGFGLLFSFAAYTAFDRPGWSVLAMIGVGLTGLCALMLIGLILMESFFRGLISVWTSGEGFAKLIVTLVLTAGLSCLMSSVGALRMKPPFGTRLQGGTLALMGILYTASLLALFGDISSSGYENEFLVLILVISILTGAGMFCVFFLYRFFGLKLPDPLSTFDQMIFLRCPRCLKEQELPVGQSHCVACRLRITVDVEEPKCPSCGYNLRALTRPICPECGKALAPEAIEVPATLEKATGI